MAAVIGDPVSHSLSPVLHNAAFDATGIDWVHVAFPVPVGAAAEAVAAMRALRLSGLSVTMPHKAAVAKEVDCLTTVAARLGAVNTIIRTGGELVGDSTDGDGFLDALAAAGHDDLRGRRVLLLGAGGAARAVALALAGAGVASIGVVGRRAAAVSQCVGLAGDAGHRATVGELAGADLVVNATPVGMTSPGVPFDVDARGLHPGQLVVDLVYSPSTTPLLGAAAARGTATINGLGMLVHQAARQFSAWTGLPAPLEAMLAAAAAAT
ncbi:MAG: shikimate dehydrogenase [Acidimicrobiales bacterium]